MITGQYKILNIKTNQHPAKYDKQQIADNKLKPALNSEVKNRYMKIKRILIANRGEIAIRIMKTARIMKIDTIAIKTAVEPNAMYLSYADFVYDNTENI